MLTAAFEADMMARKLLKEMGPKWRIRIWETDQGEWRYAVESKDGWWILSPHMKEGELEGFAAYLREKPDSNLSARWMSLGPDPYKALTNTAALVYKEANIIARANKGCGAALRATFKYRDDPDTPEYTTH